MEPVHVPTLNVRFVGAILAGFGFVTFAMSTTITRLLSVTKRHKPIQHPSDRHLMHGYRLPYSRLLSGKKGKSKPAWIGFEP